MSNTALMEASADPYTKLSRAGAGRQVRICLPPQAPDHLGKGPCGSSLRLRHSGRGLMDGALQLATLLATQGPSPWVLKGYLSDAAGVNIGGVFVRLLKAARPRSGGPAFPVGS